MVLSDLEKVRWPTDQQHVSLEKKILRAERWLTECLPQGAQPNAEKDSCNTAHLYREVQDFLMRQSNREFKLFYEQWFGTRSCSSFRSRNV